MKINAVVYLFITTFLLVTVAIFAAMGLSFSWIFYLTVLAQMLLVFSVYKVLRDDYTTDKTFKGFTKIIPWKAMSDSGFVNSKIVWQYCHLRLRT